MKNIIEGYMPYLDYQTYYRIVDGGDKTPIVLIHGGPGSTHNYMEMLDCIVESGRKVISYDQLGCGNSYLDGHPELWNADTWINELIALREHLNLKEVILLGQSWGGMLIIQYMIERKPEGVKGIVLSSTLPSSSLWAKEQHRLISFMSKKDQDAIKYAEENNIWDKPEYLHANEVFMKQHCADIKDTDPECLTRKKESGAESYLYGWGPNEYTPTGTLKDFEYTNRLHEITVPTQIMSGTNDLCTPLVAKTMFDHIPHSQWELFDGARHMCFAEQNEHYCNILNNFLNQLDEN